VVLGIHAMQSRAEPLGGHSPRFDVVRKGFYAGLLFFIVVIGLPMVSIPSLRNRLSERISTLKGAVSGNIKPAVAKVGANPEGFPKEYEAQEPALPNPFPPGSTKERGYTLVAPGLIAFEPRRAPAPSQISEAPAKEARSEPPLEPKSRSVPVVSAEPESAAEFKQGSSEKAAYDLLIRSNAAIEDLVRGGKPSLHFFTWDAVLKEEDVYWVRLRFRSEGNPGELDYIWSVNLQSGKVIPLSFNAKNID
jgi:hypothetical protein